MKEDYTVYISSDSFTQLLLAAIEAYPLESSGLLFGFMDSDPETVDFEIFSAFPHQVAEERDDEGIAENYKAYLRLIEAQRKISGHVLLGGFHSHPNSDTSISKEDKYWMKETKNHVIELIIAIEEIEEEDLGWEISGNRRRIKGGFVVGDRIFQVNISGYLLRGKKIHKVNLDCAYVEMMETLEQHGLVNFHTLGEIYARCRVLGKDVYPIYALLCELEDSLEEKESVKKELLDEIEEYLEQF